MSNVGVVTGQLTKGRSVAVAVGKADVCIVVFVSNVLPVALPLQVTRGRFVAAVEIRLV